MAAPTNGRVLIYGENGTGKELVARTHPRAQPPPRRAVRRGQLRRDSRGADRERAVRPRQGRVHRRDADRRGKFELADGGTLFLDEIGDMSLKTQAKVLRALQEQVVEPVGGADQRRASTCACSPRRTRTCRPRSAPARFREDLYFRLNVIPIFVPPLRERGDDVPRLAESLHGGARARVRAAAQDASTRGAERAAALPLAGQRPRAAQRDRAADDHGAGRHHRGCPTWRFSMAAASVERSDEHACSVPLHEARDALRARLHPQGARRAAGQHLAHRRRARRRAQQPLSQDASPSASCRHDATRKQERKDEAEPEGYAIR